MLNVIVFSKDRAMQCDVLLHSIYAHLNVEKKISILYMASSKEYEDGYSRLIDIHKNDVSFIKESSFYTNTLDLLDSNIPHTLYFADDYFMIRPFTYGSIFKEFEADEQILGINLRMGKNVVNNYNDLSMVTNTFLSENNNTEPIEFADNNTYKWRNKSLASWGYSMSVVGQIYRTKDLMGLLPRLNGITNPNTMEDGMMHNALSKKFLICPDKHIIIEVPINIVNTTHTTNPYGIISTELLNNKWLDGYRINPDCFYQLKGVSKRFIDINLEMMK